MPLLNLAANKLLPLLLLLVAGCSERTAGQGVAPPPLRPPRQPYYPLYPQFPPWPPDSPRPPPTPPKPPKPPAPPPRPPRPPRPPAPPPSPPYGPVMVGDTVLWPVSNFSSLQVCPDSRDKWGFLSTNHAFHPFSWSSTEWMAYFYDVVVKAAACSLACLGALLVVLAALLIWRWVRMCCFCCSCCGKHRRVCCGDALSVFSDPESAYLAASVRHDRLAHTVVKACASVLLVLVLAMCVWGMTELDGAVLQQFWDAVRAILTYGQGLQQHVVKVAATLDDDITHHLADLSTTIQTWLDSRGVRYNMQCVLNFSQVLPPLGVDVVSIGQAYLSGAGALSAALMTLAPTSAANSSMAPSPSPPYEPAPSLAPPSASLGLVGSLQALAGSAAPVNALPSLVGSVQADLTQYGDALEALPPSQPPQGAASPQALALAQAHSAVSGQLDTWVRRASTALSALTAVDMLQVNGTCASLANASLAAAPGCVNIVGGDNTSSSGSVLAQATAAAWVLSLGNASSAYTTSAFACLTQLNGRLAYIDDRVIDTANWTLPLANGSSTAALALFDRYAYLLNNTLISPSELVAPPPPSAAFTITQPSQSGHHLLLSPTLYTSLTRNLEAQEALCSAPTSLDNDTLATLAASLSRLPGGGSPGATVVPDTSSLRQALGESNGLIPQLAQLVAPVQALGNALQAYMAQETDTAYAELQQQAAVLTPGVRDAASAAASVLPPDMAAVQAALNVSSSQANALLSGPAPGVEHDSGAMHRLLEDAAAVGSRLLGELSEAVDIAGSINDTSVAALMELVDALPDALDGAQHTLTQALTVANHTLMEISGAVQAQLVDKVEDFLASYKDSVTSTTKMIFGIWLGLWCLGLLLVLMATWQTWMPMQTLIVTVLAFMLFLGVISQAAGAGLSMGAQVVGDACADAEWDFMQRNYERQERVLLVMASYYLYSRPDTMHEAVLGALDVNVDSVDDLLDEALAFVSDLYCTHPDLRPAVQQLLVDFERILLNDFRYVLQLWASMQYKRVRPMLKATKRSVCCTVTGSIYREFCALTIAGYAVLACGLVLIALTRRLDNMVPDAAGRCCECTPIQRPHKMRHRAATAVAKAMAAAGACAAPPWQVVSGRQAPEVHGRLDSSAGTSAARAPGAQAQPDGGSCRSDSHGKAGSCADQEYASGSATASHDSPMADAVAAAQVHLADGEGEQTMEKAA